MLLKSVAVVAGVCINLEASVAVELEMFFRRASILPRRLSIWSIFRSLRGGRESN